MPDVFELQDEIAHKIAEALRITLTPQEQEALAGKPTENLQAYDLFLRGKSYARRVTRQDMEFALQMFENAVALDPAVRARARRDRVHLRAVSLAFRAREKLDRGRQGREPAGERARQGRPGDPGRGRMDPLRGRPVRGGGRFRAHGDRAQAGHAREPTTCWDGRSSPPGRYQEVVDMAEAAIAASGEDYNIYVPISNALGALGKDEVLRHFVHQRIQVLEAHLKKIPEDARGRTLLATDYVHVQRGDDALREASLAMALRPNDAMVMYNVACVFGKLERKQECLDALQKAWSAGFRDPAWARRDPDLAIARGDPEFERLYPETAPGA